MKKRWLLYVTFGFVFYLIFLIIQIPASWFAWGLNQLTHGTVRLDPINGSLWSGKGRIVIYYPQTVPHDLGGAEWSINPLWLLTGHIQMHWKTATQDTNINTLIKLGFGQAQWIDTDISFPAQAINEFYPPAALISPKGQVQLHTAKLSIDANGIVGSGEILWKNAESGLSSVQPLGDYRLEIMGEGKAANLKLITIRGALELNAQGKWEIQNGHLQINGAAIPRERTAELEPLLKFFGEDQGNGQRKLATTAAIPVIKLSGQ